MAEENPRIEICDSKGDPIAAATPRNINEWGENQIDGTQIFGFHSNGEKIKVLQVFTGYTDEQMQSPFFKESASKDAALFEAIMGSKRFDIGTYAQNLDIGLTQQQRLITVDYSIDPKLSTNMTQTDALWSAIRQQDPTIDLLIVRVNPEIVDASILKKSSFGAGQWYWKLATASGPNMSEPDGHATSDSVFIMAHETFHTIRGLQSSGWLSHTHNMLLEGALNTLSPSVSTALLDNGNMELEDGYHYKQHNPDALINGRHSELTLAPSIDQLDHYYPAGTMPQKFKEILTRLEPEIEDAGFQCTHNGKTHPVYAYNKGHDMMEGHSPRLTNAEIAATFHTSGQGLPVTRIHYPEIFSPLQQALIEMVTSDYLVREGRIKSEPEHKVASHGLPAQIAPQTRGSGIGD